MTSKYLSRVVISRRRRGGRPLMQRNPSQGAVFDAQSIVYLTVGAEKLLSKQGGGLTGIVLWHGTMPSGFMSLRPWRRLRGVCLIIVFRKSRVQGCCRKQGSESFTIEGNISPTQSSDATTHGCQTAGLRIMIPYVCRPAQQASEFPSCAGGQ